MISKRSYQSGRNACLVVSFMVGLLFLQLSSCTTKPPEEQIQAYLETAVKKAENKSASGLKKLILPTYEDKRGLNRQDLVRIAAGYFHRRLNVFVKIKTGGISLSENDKKAKVHVIAAVSSQPIDEELKLLQAKFHDFNLDLVFDGDWLLKSLEWKRATVDDFLSF